MKAISLIAYSLLVLALCAWAGILYAGAAVQSAAAARAQDAVAAQQQSDKAAYATRLHALANDTAEERRQLDEIANADIVTVAGTIESAGKSVAAKVNDALPVGAAIALPGGGQAQALSFVVSAQGSFSALMRTLDLYEHLALPSQVEQVELEKIAAADSKSAPWRMTLRIRIVTSAPISS